MKLNLQNDRVVYLGPTFEESSWGYVQFPRLYAMRNGNIGLAIHDDDDSWMAFGDEGCGKKWLVSEDEGASWRNATKADIDMMGTVLPNGDVIRSLSNPPASLNGVKEGGNLIHCLPSDDFSIKKPDKPNQLPTSITTVTNVFEEIRKVYWLDAIPDELIEKRFVLNRLKAGETQAEKLYAEANWNYRTVQSFPPSHVAKKDLEKIMLSNAGLFECREPKVAPDGSLYIAHYNFLGANPFTGVYEGTCNAYILRSTDNGEHWELQGYIPYKDFDEEKDPFAHLKGGFSEPCLEFMPDGSMLCILRTCDVFYNAPSWGPTYLSRSTDGGKTWSKPEYFKDRGALPQLLQLKNGVTLAVITRPGIYVYASEDGGKTWTECVEVMTEQDRSGLGNEKPQRPNFWQWAGSCCNCTIYPLADNKALLTYSDFFIPDEVGVKRKGIKTIEIVVE